MQKIIFILLLGISQVFFGQNLQNKNSFKSDVIIGELENGLQYVIKPIESNESKIHTGLTVKAGSFQENADQYNIAHLLEHLAFNSTENFPDMRNEAKFLSQFHMEAMDLTAHVGGTATRYLFRYPKEQTIALDTALSIYRDIASGKLIFDKKAVLAEKKAIYQERLQGGDPNQNYADWKVISQLTGCYEIPKPENVESTLMHTSLEDLKRFYQDWYRPELMVISVVGNIEDTDVIEQKIKNKFGSLKNPAEKFQKKDCEGVYLNSENQFIVQKNAPVLNSETEPGNIFQFFYRNPRLYLKKFTEEENKIIWNSLAKHIKKRLKSDEENYNINYQTNFFRSDDIPALKLSILTTDNELKTIERVFKVLGGISKYGFTKKEWNSIKNELISNNRRIDYSSSQVWMDLIKHSVEDLKKLEVSGINNRRGFLQTLELNKINSILKDIDWKPDDIAVIIPPNEQENIFSRKLIEKSIKKGLSEPKKYQPLEAPENLIGTKELSNLKPANIVERKFGDYNEDVIVLENGLKIILKNFRPEAGRYKDKIMVHGFSPYGASCFGPFDFEAFISPFIVKNIGVGEFNKFVINKRLSSTSIPFGVRDYVEQYETGVKAEAASEDMEILLQLLFLSFTDPRFDKEAFEDWKLQEKYKSKRITNANNDFIDFKNREVGITKIPQGGNRYYNSLEVDYTQALKKYKQLHSRAKDFTFILTGDFKKNEILPLLQKYLGNLPNKKGTINCKRSPNKNDSQPIGKGNNANFKLPYKADNKLLSIQYATPLNSPFFKEEIDAEILKQALGLKLIKMRYKEKLGVYFPLATRKFDQEYNRKTMEIFLQSSKSDFEKVLESSLNYVEELKTELVSENFLKSVKNSSYLPKWQQQYRNKSMRINLYNHYRYNIPYLDSAEAEGYFNEFDSNDLLKVAKEYFNSKSKWVLTGGYD
ncbi:M16 family metallopeptidase [Salegentibacter flavus]|uniref:Predicted Zn-dependent peptidase n=1 Tax=Salegentibacter flavus TaxID=287099 RepID=A0A1I4YIY2_9FLAO|nr:insulinase family protein [Salegentibacter flavus]SFN37519.1 Predicted Zn-dependent peptidase [Salegentibacter flavus]